MSDNLVRVLPVPAGTGINLQNLVGIPAGTKFRYTSGCYVWQRSLMMTRIAGLKLLLKKWASGNTLLIFAVCSVAYLSSCLAYLSKMVPSFSFVLPCLHCWWWQLNLRCRSVQFWELLWLYFSSLTVSWFLFKLIQFSPFVCSLLFIFYNFLLYWMLKCQIV